MIKKLDILVIRGFLGPFLAGTFIMLLLLVFQFLWMFIDDLIGKGLDVFVLFRLIFYISITLLPMCLPIGVLFASLISFGDMGEHFELVSIKAAGISFGRFLRPTILMGVFIVGLALFISNEIIPTSYKKYTNLFLSILSQKPALNLKEGVFYDQIDNYIIRANSKSEDGKILHDMIIIEKAKNTGTKEYDNVIFAKRGTMTLTADNQGLVFTLYDGWYYQESAGENDPDRSVANNQLTRVFFKEYMRILTVSGFGHKEDRGDGKDYKAMRLSEIDRELRKRHDNFYLTRPYVQNSIRTSLPIWHYIDSPRHAFASLTDTSSKMYLRLSLLVQRQDTIQSLRSTDSDVLLMHAHANRNTGERFLQTLIDNYKYDIRQFKQANNRLKIEWHKKFSLSFSCLVFMIIGTSLGAIIRKGGIGMPLIIAVSFFVFYYFTSSSLEKYASQSDSTLSSFWALWAPNFFLLPLGVYLAYRVLNDAPIVSERAYGWFVRLLPWRKSVRFLLRKKRAKEA